MFRKALFFVVVSSSFAHAAGLDTPLVNSQCPLDKDQKDVTVWPNCMSSANSDPWIRENHSKIRKMRPRVLVINFANDTDMKKAHRLAESLCECLKEGSRYLGFKDPKSPAFLDYRIVKVVDMRDDPIVRSKQNSRLAPYRKSGGGRRFSTVCDYSRFYSKAFARRYGFKNGNGGFFDLHELIRRGYIHELWFFWIHDKRGAPLETIEDKLYYDINDKPSGRHGAAGNGHCPSMPWSGRSFRITFMNPNRGIGCAMENLSHAMEGMAHYNSVPCFRKYFYEFAHFDLYRKYSLPRNSFYALIRLGRKGDHLEYHPPGGVTVYSGKKVFSLTRFKHIGGNVHFPPGARGHYDLHSPYTVKSTIENYRQRNGVVKGTDKVLDFNCHKFDRYRRFCPDGMGAWLIFWRQCMPGYHNKCFDDNGKPMKNWWVYLFY